jgi:hypothetical protein
MINGMVVWSIEKVEEDQQRLRRALHFSHNGYFFRFSHLSDSIAMVSPADFWLCVGCGLCRDISSRLSVMAFMTVQLLTKMASLLLS